MNKRRNLSQPISEEICFTRPCYNWIHSDQWTPVRILLTKKKYRYNRSLICAQCSAACNGGYEENIPRCVLNVNSTQQVVNNQLCQDIVRPQIRRSCNNQPCSSKPPNVNRRRGRRRRWDIGPWSLVRFPANLF